MPILKHVMLSISLGFKTKLMLMNKNSIKHEIFKHNFATLFLNYDNLVILQALLLQPIGEFDDFRQLGSALFMNKVKAVPRL